MLDNGFIIFSLIILFFNSSSDHRKLLNFSHFSQKFLSFFISNLPILFNSLINVEKYFFRTM
ncbi:MAG: hypothetical protein Q8S84_09590 [bacterium]|nr:hypothetical protein [bacterium]